MSGHQDLVWMTYTLRRVFDIICVDVIIQCLLSDGLRHSPARRLSWYKGWSTPRPVFFTIDLEIWRRLATRFQRFMAALSLDSPPIREVRNMIETNDEPDACDADGGNMD